MKFLNLIVLLVFLLLNSPIFGQTTYYVSKAGNDSNNGSSPGTPWKTLKKLAPGNTYLLKKADTFYFQIEKVNNPFNQQIVIGAYGEGSKPVISLVKNIYTKAWQNAGANLWKVNLKDTSNYSGFLDNSDTNVGFLKVGDKIKGNKLSSLDQLKSNWDFYSDDQFLFIYFDGDPLKINLKIQCTTNKNIVVLSDDMKISDVALEGTGAHGIDAYDAKNIVLDKITIKDIGGSYLPHYRKGDTRYGNGIQFWEGATNCLIEHCNVANVYDVAYTIQSTSPKSVYDNVVFKNNIAKNNEQSFEFWVSDSTSYFKDCQFIDNYCENAGLGWSHAVRPDNKVGVHLLSYFWTKGMTGLTITNNTFTGAKSGFMALPKNLPKEHVFKSFKNKIYLAPQVPIRANDTTAKLKSGKDFIKSTGMEKGSEFKILHN